MLDLAINQRQFIAEYFEKNFFLSPRAVDTSVFSWRAVTEVLYSWDPADAQLRLFKEGLVPQAHYVERFQDVQQIRSGLNKRTLEAYLRKGATLVIDRIERKMPLIGALCHAFSDFTNEKTVANAYLAFGGEGSFGQHWDTHDVFAVQLMGRKRWTVFKPTFPLPIEEQKSRGYANHVPCEQVFEGVLNPGDVLYIPRGWWHEAIPLPNQETFHLAVGAHTAKTADYAIWLCNQVLSSSIAARQTFKRNADNTAALHAFLQVFSQAILDPYNLTMFNQSLQSLSNKYELIDLDQFVHDIPISEGEKHRPAIT